ncbi:MAG TPA: protein kinase [Candidatus Tectomicrobia bacterium]|jgi:serine/threonine-protein kinase
MIGRTIGTYKITGTVGSGGMGEVFMGEDLMLERQVAIKQLRPELANRPDVVQRFRSEAVLLAKLQHTNIATVYAFLQEGANFFLVMEYVQGWTLQNVIEVHGALAPAVAVGLVQQALAGLGFAHQRQIIHRDLKPANVMLTDSGVIKLMDFGLARVLGSAHLTRLGRLVGTLEYVSPEQIRGAETDARADIYSLGIVLYELVTGRLPFESESEYALMQAQVEALPPSPRQVTPGISPQLEHVILRALAKSPQERFQSTEAFSLALTHCVPQAEPQDTLAALLTVLTGHSRQTAPAKTPPQATRQVAPPAAAAAQVKATRRATVMHRSATEPLPSGRPWTWENYLVPGLILASSVAAVGLLFFLGMPYAPRGPELSSRPSAEVISHSTNPLPVEAQPADHSATPIQSEASRASASTATATPPLLGVPAEERSVPSPAPGNALPQADPEPLREALPQPVVATPLIPSAGGEGVAKAPSLLERSGTTPPAVLLLPESNTEGKAALRETSPQELKGPKKKPPGAAAPRLLPEKPPGPVEGPLQTSGKDSNRPRETAPPPGPAKRSQDTPWQPAPKETPKGSGGWYIKK